MTILNKLSDYCLSAFLIIISKIKVTILNGKQTVKADNVKMMSVRWI